MLFLKAPVKILFMPSPKRRLLLEAIVILGVVRTGLTLFAFKAVYVALDRRSRGRLRPSPEYPVSVVWALNHASAIVPGGNNCLARALSAKALLARRGQASVLRIGVARNQDRKFEAHAWLECDDRILIGKVDVLDRFKPLPDFEEGLR